MKAKIIGGTAAAVIALSAAVLVKPREGYAPTPYIDMVGVATYCYGDTECAARLNSRLGEYLTGIQACIHVPLEQHEWAALLSWSYNVGTTAACGSSLVSKINSGRPASAWCAELDRWVYAGGKRVQGLVDRRAAERRMCEGRS
jgi:lysozyme